MPLDAQARLNPNIKTVDVGTRKLRTVKIYPLSLTDQQGIIDTVIDAVATFMDRRLAGELVQTTEMVRFAVDALKENINKIIAFVTDPDEAPKPEELTNAQLVEIVNVIYTENFEGPAKNVSSLISGVTDLFRSMRSSQNSLSDIPNLDLSTSSPAPSEKAD